MLFFHSWNEGRNHLIFNMLPGSTPDYYPFPEIDLGNAMVTSGGFSSLTFRSGFDVSIPVFSSLSERITEANHTQHKKWLILSAQANIHDEFREVIQDVAAEHPSFLVLDVCSQDQSNVRIRCRNEEVFPYPSVMKVW